MYEIFFSRRAEKQFKKLELCIQDRIISTLERIRIRPKAHVIKLVGDPGYKLRVGEYRVIMDIKQNELLIFVIKMGHRKKIYK